eukprot:3522219-Prymnesium_polylepis.1
MIKSCRRARAAGGGFLPPEQRVERPSGGPTPASAIAGWPRDPAAHSDAGVALRPPRHCRRTAAEELHGCCMLHGCALGAAWGRVSDCCCRAQY